jgi:polyisoprenoid-binding protein YceI
MKLPLIHALNRLRPSTALAALAALAFCLGPVQRAGAQGRYNSQPRGSSVRVNGTSTTHDWEMESTIIGGYIEFGAGVTLDKTQAAPAGLSDNKAPAKAHVIISVRSIHSKVAHLPEVMDNLMCKAMKEDRFPTIEFTLTGLTFKGPHAAGQPFNFDTAGELSIAGVTNKVSFPVAIECLEEGRIKLSGSAPVKMTAYGIDPPAPNIGLGLMKCGDDVKISFDWTLKERK